MVLEKQNFEKYFLHFLLLTTLLQVLLNRESNLFLYIFTIFRLFAITLYLVNYITQKITNFKLVIYSFLIFFYSIFCFILSVPIYLSFFFL